MKNSSTLKIGDLGLAKQLEKNTANSYVGTLLYMR